MTQLHEVGMHTYSLLLIGMASAFILLVLLFLSVLLHNCSETIIKKGTVLNEITVTRDTSYNTLAKMGLVFGPVKVAGSSASCR